MLKHENLNHPNKYYSIIAGESPARAEGVHVRLEYSPPNSTWSRKWVRELKCGLIRTTCKVLGNFSHTSDRREGVIIFVQYGRHNISTDILFSRTVRVSYSTTSTRTAAAEQQNVSDTTVHNAAVQLLQFVDFMLLGLRHYTPGTAGAAKFSCCPASPFGCCS